MSLLIRIYTVYHSVFDFKLASLFAKMDMSNLIDERVHFRNSRMKGLKEVTLRFVYFYQVTCLRLAQTVEDITL